MYRTQDLLYYAFMFLIGAVVLGVFVFFIWTIIAHFQPPRQDPHWVHACIETRTEMLMMPTRVGDTTVMRPQPVTRCIQREWQCHMGERYEGQSCGPLPLQDGGS